MNSKGRQSQSSSSSRKDSTRWTELSLVIGIVIAAAYCAWAQLFPYPVDTWSRDAPVSVGTGNLGLGSPLHPGIGMAADGVGGAIVAWDNQESPQPIVSQHLSATGTLLWSSPVAITEDSSLQESPISVSDGAGGAIIVWLDGRYTDTLFAQHLDSSGTRLWSADGVLMTATFGNPQYYSMVSDGSGGAIVAWEGDPSPDECCAIFAQRILSGGTPAWSAGGVLLTPDPTFTAVKTVSDGAGGAIIAFANGAGIDPVPLEVQRIGPDGSIMWNSGVTVGRMFSAYNNDFDLVSDGAGGAIIAWDTTLAGFPAIEAQRLDPDGNPLWSAGGVMVVSITGNLFISDLAGDGAGGAVAIWDDSRNDPSHNSQDCANAGDVCNVYAQRLSAPMGAHYGRKTACR